MLHIVKVIEETELKVEFNIYELALVLVTVYVLKGRGSNTRHICLLMSGADPENFSRGGPTLGKKNPITHTVTHTHTQ